MSEAISELGTFLRQETRLDLKDYALSEILSLSGDSDALRLIQDNENILSSLIMLLEDPNKVISKNACLILVNISANIKGASQLVHLNISKLCKDSLIPPQPLPKHLVKLILDPNCHFVDAACMVLSNLSRNSSLVDKIIDNIDTSYWQELISAFTAIGYNKQGGNLDYLGPILSNLSQSATVRKFILDRENSYMQRLLAFTEYSDSIVRRGGVIGTIKNCCFDSDNHQWLLSSSVDILPKLLLPLAGPEEFGDDEMEKLPPDLQYLPEDKRREIDPDLRCMLLEALTQLCALKTNREYIRSKNAYLILRELHKNETDAKVLLACENLVDILIRTEEEIGEDDLKSLEIPQEVVKKLEKL